MADYGAIRVDGLREFQRSLKDFDAGLPKALRAGLKEVSDLIVSDAKPRIPNRSGRTRGSVKATSNQKGAVVRAGAGLAHYGWLDFGGSRFVKGRRAKESSRKFMKSGRYIWRAFGDNYDESLKLVENALVMVARRAGLEVTDG